LAFLTRFERVSRDTSNSRAILEKFGFFSRIAAAKAFAIRSSLQLADLGILGG
jgi:hypothetical protein